MLNSPFCCLLEISIISLPLVLPEQAEISTDSENWVVTLYM